MLDTGFRILDKPKKEKFLIASSIQKPASSIGLIPAHKFEKKLDLNFKILAHKDT